MASGQVSGQPINLAGNYAVTFSSLNTNIAVVNPNGLVIGAGAGTTAIVAAYAGMTATQSVQVLAASLDAVDSPVQLQ